MHPHHDHGGLVAQPRTSGMAVAGLVTAFLCSLLGLILSIIALGDIKRSNGALQGEGLATAGIVVSIFMMIVGVLVAASGK
jgi:hypothetical protein